MALIMHNRLGKNLAAFSALLQHRGSSQQRRTRNPPARHSPGPPVSLASFISRCLCLSSQNTRVSSKQELTSEIWFGAARTSPMRQTSIRFKYWGKKNKRVTPQLSCLRMAPRVLHHPVFQRRPHFQADSSPFHLSSQQTLTVHFADGYTWGLILGIISLEFILGFRDLH